MSPEGSHYQAFLAQKQFIEALSPGGADLNRLFFQDMVLEQLSEAERLDYILFLLEPRHRAGRDLNDEALWRRSTPGKVSLWQWIGNTLLHRQPLQTDTSA